jgi:hypothetical protein
MTYFNNLSISVRINNVTAIFGKNWLSASKATNRLICRRAKIRFRNVLQARYIGLFCRR